VARTPRDGDAHRDPASIARARDGAARLLHAAIPGEPEDPGCWPAWRALAVQVAAYAGHAPAHTDTREAAFVLDRAGTFLHGQGSLPQAVSHLRRAVEDYERLYGPDRALSSRNNLASAYQAGGEYRRAAELHERTLADRERILGPDHPNTLNSRENLLRARRSASQDPE
jgi:tetratricopeptide (TPR) repeat protein